ncbi:FAD-dependent oxidoreductase, partial [Streptomonospora nanhaiensis]
MPSDTPAAGSAPGAAAAAGDAPAPRRDPAPVDVLVVGGGIGGLAAALTLARSGRSVRLLERSAQFGEVGAGLQLGPNTTRLLAAWGLLEEVVGVGVLPRRLVFRDILTAEELTHLDLGEGFRARYGAPYVVVHRSDLHRILLAACERAGVELVTGARAERVETAGEAARTFCADGTVHASGAVVGADGLHSRLRDQIVGDAPVESGYVAYRGTFPLAEVPVDVSQDDVVAWLGPGCHFVQYPLRQGEMLNQVAVFRSPAFAAGAADWGGPEELDGAFAGACAPVRAALGYLWRDRFWHMRDREPADTWVRGRLGLAGDAAHPMLQYLAQGACQALEDAHELARQADRHAEAGAVDWPRALAAYQRVRVPRTARVQRTARLWGDIWHVDGVG